MAATQRTPQRQTTVVRPDRKDGMQFTLSAGDEIGDRFAEQHPQSQRMEAVGRDTDGEIKPINDLSYIPAERPVAQSPVPYESASRRDDQREGSREPQPIAQSRAYEHEEYPPRIHGVLPSRGGPPTNASEQHQRAIDIAPQPYVQEASRPVPPQPYVPEAARPAPPQPYAPEPARPVPPQPYVPEPIPPARPQPYAPEAARPAPPQPYVPEPARPVPPQPYVPEPIPPARPQPYAPEAARPAPRQAYMQGDVRQQQQQRPYAEEAAPHQTAHPQHFVNEAGMPPREVDLGQQWIARAGVSTTGQSLGVAGPQRHGDYDPPDMSEQGPMPVDWPGVGMQRVSYVPEQRQEHGGIRTAGQLGAVQQPTQALAEPIAERRPATPQAGRTDERLGQTVGSAETWAPERAAGPHSLREPEDDRPEGYAGNTLDRQQSGGDGEPQRGARGPQPVRQYASDMRPLPLRAENAGVRDADVRAQSVSPSPISPLPPQPPNMSRQLPGRDPSAAMAFGDSVIEFADTVSTELAHASMELTAITRRVEELEMLREAQRAHG
jgi:hypothetical protein